MTNREQYTPCPLRTLALVREPRHSPEKIWLAPAGPAHLRAWAPVNAQGSNDTAPGDRLEDLLDGRVPADMFSRFAGMRESL